MGASPDRIESVCVFCGSSAAADPRFLSDAGAFGRPLARAGLRLVYGGGGVGLMGACARAAHEAGGDVRGTCEREPRPDAPCDSKNAHVAYILAADDGDADANAYAGQRARARRKYFIDAIGQQPTFSV